MPPSFFQCRLCGYVNYGKDSVELDKKLKAHFVKSHKLRPDLCSERVQKNTVIGNRQAKDGRWTARYSTKNISPLVEDWKEFVALNTRRVNSTFLPDQFPPLHKAEKARLADLEAEFQELPYRIFRCSRADVDEFSALRGEV